MPDLEAVVFQFASKETRTKTSIAIGEKETYPADYLWEK